jgi:hypothetical protein
VCYNPHDFIEYRELIHPPKTTLHFLVSVVQEHVKILCVGGAITAVAGGLLQKAIAELDAAKIDPKVRLNYAGKVQISSKIVISVK